MPKPIDVRVPATSKIVDANGPCTVYRLYLDGSYHSAPRYSRIAELDSILRKNVTFIAHPFDKHNARYRATSNSLCLPEYLVSLWPPFPPKKFPLIKMSDADIEQRRQALESYLQFVFSVEEIVEWPTFTDFVISLQLDSHQVLSLERCEVDVSFVNDSHLAISTTTDAGPSEVLRLICEEINLPAKLRSFFGLFLASPDNATSRCLLNCESVWIAISSSKKQTSRLMFRRDYYVARLDEALLANPTAINLLFVEATRDWKAGLVSPTPSQQADLESLKLANLKPLFLETIRNTAFYCAAYFNDASILISSNCGEELMPQRCSCVRIGNGFITAILVEQERLDFSLKIISTWHVKFGQSQTLSDGAGSSSANSLDDDETSELVFQNRNDYSSPTAATASSGLSVVRILSPQAQMMGHCLGRMIENYVQLRSINQAHHSSTNGTSATGSNLTENTASGQVDRRSHSSNVEHMRVPSSTVLQMSHAKAAVAGYKMVPADVIGDDDL